MCVNTTAAKTPSSPPSLLGVLRFTFVHVWCVCVSARVWHKVGYANVGMAVLCMALVVVIPLIRSIVGLIMWFIPMRVASLRRCVILSNQLGILASADVYAVACVIMIWQLPQLFSHMEEASRYVYMSIIPLPGLLFFFLGAIIDATLQSVIIEHAHERFVGVLSSAKPRQPESAV